MTDRKTDVAKWAALALAVLLAVVTAVAWAVTASSDAGESRERIRDHETRIRTVEQIVPRIDEKLANIERMVREDKKK